MKVKKLISMLKKEKQSAEVFVWLGTKEGWEVIPIGYDDAIIGHGGSKKRRFVLLPVKGPLKYKKWAEEDKE